MNYKLCIGKTILLVEDNKKIQMFNKRMLERNHFSIEMAFTLDEARNILARQTPAAIILDIGMPDGNGLEFLRELRKTSQIPVLLLTGYSIDSDFVMEFATERIEYLAKPYEFEALLGRLMRLLQRGEN